MQNSNMSCLSPVKPLETLTHKVLSRSTSILVTKRDNVFRISSTTPPDRLPLYVNLDAGAWKTSKSLKYIEKSKKELVNVSVKQQKSKEVIKSTKSGSLSL